VRENLRQYFQAHKITGGKFEFAKLISLAAATVRDLDQLAPWVPIALFDHALKGTLLPEALLTTAVRRCSVGKNDLQGDRHHVDHAQAALVKMCLISNHARKGEILPEEWMVKLDLNCDSPAYLYGRLFNVLEQIQHEASGGDSVERTFGTAVMSPVSTLPRLTARAKQAHLPKLRRDKGAAYVRFEKLLDEIIGQLGSEHAFQIKLNAEEQGLFILGYYHQNAHRWEEIEAAKLKRAEREDQNSTTTKE